MHHAICLFTSQHTANYIFITILIMCGTASVRETKWTRWRSLIRNGMVNRPLYQKLITEIKLVLKALSTLLKHQFNINDWHHKGTTTSMYVQKTCFRENRKTRRSYVPLCGHMIFFDTATYYSSSSSRMRVMNHNWSATKQRLHPQSVAEMSCHSVLSGDRIRQCGTSSGSRHKDTDQCL